MNARAPSEDQTIVIHGGSNIQGGPLQPLPESYPEIHLGPRPNVSSRPYRVCGRGKGRALHKNAAAPAQNQNVFIQGGSDIQFMPLDPAHSAPVLPPPKAVRCELCKVECNTLDILKQHMNGKKHKKKLKFYEELQNLNKRVIGRQIEQTSTSELKSEVPSHPNQIEGSGNLQLEQEILPSQEINEESKVAVEKQEVKEVEPSKESAAKVRTEHSESIGRGLKRKMRGGKGSRRMKPCDRSKKLVEPLKPKEVIPLVCELCNVKCESPVVFQSHLVGKKHQSKAKRFIGQQETPGQELIQAQLPATQALDQRKANASTSISFQLHDQGSGTYQGASAQNVNIINVHASTLEANAKCAKVEAISEPESLPANLGASTLVNAEPSSNEGHSETGLQNNYIAAKIVGMADGSEPAMSGTTLDGGSFSEQSVVASSSALVALPGRDTITGQAQSKGTDQAR